MNSEKIAHEEYFRRKYSIIEYHYRIRLGLIRSLLTIASGAIILSITLFNEVFKNPRDTIYFHISLACWGATILFALLICGIDLLAHNKQLKLLDDQFKKIKESGYNNLQIEAESNCWECLLNLLYIFIILSFIGGVLFLVIFFYINFPK